MRKTLIYVVSLLVCLGLVGAVWAGKPGGRKTKEGGKIPVTVTFRDPSIAPDDLIRSDGPLTYTDGDGGVEAFLQSGNASEGQLVFGTGTEAREVTLNFDFPSTLNPDGTVDLKGAKCTDARFPSMDKDCRTFARLITFSKWELDVETGALRELHKNKLNLLTMRIGSAAFVSFNIRFPSQFKAKANLLGFGFSGQGSPVTVTRGGTGAEHTWTIEAVELGGKLSVAVLHEGNAKPGKDGLFTPTGSGELPFLIKVECIDATQCPVL